MEKLFAALRERHQGYKVIDVRLMLDFSEVNGRRASDMDEEFAKAIIKSKRVDLDSITF